MAAWAALIEAILPILLNSNKKKGQKQPKDQPQTEEGMNPQPQASNLNMQPTSVLGSSSQWQPSESMNSATRRRREQY